MPKSTKSKKITNQDKAWVKKSKPTSYKVNSRPLNKLILIVCEGQTEEQYFKSFPVLGLTVDVQNLKGQSKLKLVNVTEGIVKKSKIKYDEIWCVFDMDVKRGEKEYSDFDNAIHCAKSKKYNVAYSNDAFELWFYLHFEYTETSNHRKFYYQFLGRKFNINYSDDGKKLDFCREIYKMLLNYKDANQDKAIERAEMLYLKSAHLTYHKRNPVTKVYKLVKMLRL